MSISFDGQTQIGVVGLGIMGAGIVEVFARNGFSVVAVAESDQAVELGQKNLATSLERAQSKGKLTADDATQISARITWASNFEALRECGLVIEAAPEVIELKSKIFAQLDAVVRPDAVLASNTSSLSITEIASSTKRPKQVVGLHFFNPAPVQKFVEIITTTDTDETLVAALRSLTAQAGKQAAVIADRPGFIVNRLLLVYINHAAQLLAEGKYDLATIDSAMRERAGFPMGPLELADLIGLDTCVAILQTIAQFTHDKNHEPASNLVAHVAGKNFGRKSGAGFYSYAQRHVPAQSTNESAKSEVFEILHSAYLADAAQMAASGYATAQEINAGMMLGCGLPQGPLAD